MLDGAAVWIANIQGVALQNDFGIADQAINFDPQVVGVHELILADAAVFFTFDVSAVLAELDDFRTGRLFERRAVRRRHRDAFEIPLAVKRGIGFRGAADAA